MLNIACSEQNDADNLIGTYSVSTVQNVIWGNASTTLTDHGVLRITKISASCVQLSGYFNTTGKVVGSNIYLKSYTDSDGKETSYVDEDLRYLGERALLSAIFKFQFRNPPDDFDP